MPDDNQPVSSSQQPPAVPPPPPHSAGHTPITEEFDRAKWTMPAAVPIMIAAVIVIVAVALIVFVNRAKPSASGSITKVVAAAQEGSVMVAIHMKFDNVTNDRLWIKGISAELETADGTKYTDNAAPAVDTVRYLQAFPALAEGRAEPLKEEMRILPGGSLTGMIVVSFPVTQAVFDGRKSVTVHMAFYDHPGMTLRQ